MFSETVIDSRRIATGKVEIGTGQKVLMMASNVAQFVFGLIILRLMCKNEAIFDEYAEKEADEENGENDEKRLDPSDEASIHSD